jgi:hypothetical protein
MTCKYYTETIRKSSDQHSEGKSVYCLLTLGMKGPDGLIVHRDMCDESRACFEPAEGADSDSEED